MSVEAMSWAWKQNLPTGMKFTLVTLSNFADMEEGTCYPGQARLGSMTGQHANTIAKHLAVLEEDGYLTRERRINSKGHRTSDRYRLHLDRVAPESLPTETGGRDSGALTTPEAIPNHTLTLNPYPHPGCGGTVREQPSVEPLGAPTMLTLVQDPPDKQAKKRKDDTTRLPDGWKPTFNHVEFAAEKGLDLPTEVMAFRAHAEANDRRQVVWNAAFTQWLITSTRFNRQAPPAQKRSASTPEGW